MYGQLTSVDPPIAQSSCCVPVSHHVSKVRLHAAASSDPGPHIIIKYGGCRYFFQGVHMLLAFGCSAEGMGQPWAADEKRLNKLVFIGRNLDRAELNKNFRACLAATAA